VALRGIELAAEAGDGTGGLRVARARPHDDRTAECEANRATGRYVRRQGPCRQDVAAGEVRSAADTESAGELYAAGDSGAEVRLLHRAVDTDIGSWAEQNRNRNRIHREDPEYLAEA
jgi:hypothetical protein